MQDHDVYKRRLDQNGVVIPDSEEKHQVGPEQDDKLLHKHNETECGSCYGAAPDEECCNSCDEVPFLQDAFRNCRNMTASFLSFPKTLNYITAFFRL